MENANKQRVVYMLLHVYDLTKYNIEAKMIGIYSNRTNAKNEAKKICHSKDFEIIHIPVFV